MANSIITRKEKTEIVDLKLHTNPDFGISKSNPDEVDKLVILREINLALDKSPKLTVPEGLDCLSFQETQHLKFGMQKEKQIRRNNSIKRGPWVNKKEPPRKWYQESNPLFASTKVVYLKGRYPSIDIQFE